MPLAKPSRDAVPSYRTRGVRVDAVNPAQAQPALLDSRGHRHLTQRVYGPGLMLATLDASRRVGLPQYLYGDSADALDGVSHQLRVQFGTPPQDALPDAERDQIPATLVAIGAAFDFLAGAKRHAPRWMQGAGRSRRNR